MGLRVVFAEDNYLLREGTVALLATVEELEVVAAVGDLPSLLDAVAATRPNAVLTDIRMPPTHAMEGIEAARQLRATDPDGRCCVRCDCVEQRDCWYENPSLSPWSRDTVGLRRLPLPIRRDRAGGSLVPALRVVLSRC